MSESGVDTNGSGVERFGKHVLAFLVLLIAAWIVIKLVIGIVAALFVPLLVIGAIVAFMWAWRVLF
jgi:H+/Cl- antiporter ClcA